MKYPNRNETKMNFIRKGSVKYTLVLGKITLLWN